MLAGWGEWLVIAAVIVIVFSARKLPALGGAIGETFRSFKKGFKDERPTREVHEIKKPDSDENA